VSLDDYLDYKYKNRVDLPDVTPEMRNTINIILGRNLGSVGDYQVAERVMSLGAHSPNLKLASARAYTPESIKTNNVILIGGPQSNPWVELYKDRMDFYVEYDAVQQPYIHHQSRAVIGGTVSLRTLMLSLTGATAWLPSCRILAVITMP
jgi:hypothetical protein